MVFLCSCTDKRTSLMVLTRLFTCLFTRLFARLHHHAQAVEQPEGSIRTAWCFTAVTELESQSPTHYVRGKCLYWTSGGACTHTARVS